MHAVPALDPVKRAFLETARSATLATIGPDGRPRLVPICFAVGADDGRAQARLYSPLDDKPKASADPRDLARIHDILARPDVTLLVDRWSEDWSRLGWVRIRARATLLEPAGLDREEHGAAVAALRAKYPQYASHHLDEHPVLRFDVVDATSWGNLAPD